MLIKHHETWNGLALHNCLSYEDCELSILCCGLSIHSATIYGSATSFQQSPFTLAKYSERYSQQSIRGGSEETCWPNSGGESLLIICFACTIIEHSWWFVVPSHVFVSLLTQKEWSRTFVNPLSHYYKSCEIIYSNLPLVGILFAISLLEHMYLSKALPVLVLWIGT